MAKQIKIVVIFITVALFLFAACDNTITPDPSGIFTPAPGAPGGGDIGSSQGEIDPSYTGFRFNASSFETLPSVAVWNSLGHQHAFPDLFHFANGNKVVTKEDWEARRAEISRILQYYEYGIMPSIREEDGVQIELSNSGDANTTFTVTYQGRLFTFTITTTLPAGAGSPETTNPNYGHLGLYFSSSGANWTGGTATWNGGTFASEGDGSGAVPTLFGINHTTPDAPSANMSYAWGMSVILTGIEGIDINGDGTIDPETEKAFRGWYDPNKVGITGYSRGGKAVECVAAFAEGRGGSRVGHVAIGSAGSGGPALERFLSPAGYRDNRGLPADPLPIGEVGIMDYSQLKGKAWYIKKMNNGDPTSGGGPSVQASAGSADDYRYRTVRGWSPYFESYERSPFLGTAEDTTPFVGWQTPSSYWSGNQGYWGGIQSLSEGRNETPGWFSVRFREFQDLHYGLDIDHVTGNEFRSPYGILCTIPFDQHYLSALIAPRGILFQDGLGVPRNNPDSQFANWVIIDEVYKFLGEKEGNEYKYIWRNGAVYTWGTHGSNTGNEAPDRNYHATRVFEDFDAKAGIGGTPLPDSGTTPPDDYHLFKTRDPAYNIDDPIGRFDYYRVNWGRPNHPSVADRVRSRLPDALIAAYEADEVNRPQPWTYGGPQYNVSSQIVTVPNPPPAAGDGTTIPTTVTTTYTGWRTPTAAPSVPRFRPMDWRGLIDSPESQ